ALIGQVRVELVHLLGDEQAFVDDRPTGEADYVETASRGDIAGGDRPFRPLTGEVECLLELRAVAAAPAHKDLPDVRHTPAGFDTDCRGVDRDIPPAEYRQPGLRQRCFQGGFTRPPVLLPLWQKEHSHRIRSRRGEIDAQRRADAPEEAIGKL